MIKKLLILAISLLLTACMNLKFDGGEYNGFINIYQSAEFNKAHNCSNITNIKDLTDHQFIYSSNRTWRKEIRTSIFELKSMVDEIYNKNGDFSNVYCQIKMEYISEASLSIIRTLGVLQ